MAHIKKKSTIFPSKNQLETKIKFKRFHLKYDTNFEKTGIQHTIQKQNHTYTTT